MIRFLEIPQTIEIAKVRRADVPSAPDRSGKQEDNEKLSLCRFSERIVCLFRKKVRKSRPFRNLLIVTAGIAALTLPTWAEDRPQEDLDLAKVTAAVVAEPIEAGPVAPTADSIKVIPCPEWFRDAKFGIWAHWGPGCISGVSQNYAQDMYQVGTPAYKYHVEHIGDPATTGYKDMLKEWTASKWDPQGLMKKYKAAGARYFVAMGRHHDNFDCYDSKYTKWNSVRIGPKKDVAGLWREAALQEGLRFGLSFHPHISYFWRGQWGGWTKKAPDPGVVYDKFDTKDPKFWSLYMPPIGTPWLNKEFDDGVYARIKDALDKCQPDLLYFDGTLRSAETHGYKIIAHFYNSNIKHHGGHNEGIVNIKTEQGGVKDLERQQFNDISPQPWQCDTSESSWFYLDESMAADELFTIHKSSTTMLHALIDIVSKNGNLLMNIPQRADGTIDEHGEILLADFAEWMKINAEAIFETRPWKVYGEGPSQLPRPISSLPPATQKLVSRDLKTPMTSKDIRFTKKGDVLYAFALGLPTEPVQIKALAGEKIDGITLLGSDAKLDWKQDADALVIQPLKTWPCRHAVVFKIQLAK